MYWLLKLKLMRNSNSKVQTNEIMTVTVFGYAILLIFIYRYFRFYFYVLPLVLVLIENIYQALKAAFDHISKHLKVGEKYTAARRIFNSILSVWKCVSHLTCKG